MKKSILLETNNDNSYMNFLEIKYCPITDKYETYDKKSNRFLNEFGQEIVEEQEDHEILIYNQILDEEYEH